MLKNLSELLSLVEINLKVRYRKTFLGFFWVLANPILLFFVQATLFGHILRRADNSYFFYLFTGLLPWFYLSQTVEMSCTYLSSHAALLKNLRLHPYKLIWALALENYINLIFSSLIVFLFLFFKFDATLVSFLVYLIFTIWLVAIVASLAFLASLINVLYKDTKYILHFIFTILYFMTPSFFYLQAVPADLQRAIKLNPFYWLISLFRISADSNETFMVLVVNLFFAAILFCVSFFFWKKYKSTIYLQL